jgi:hypothetical protein
VALLQTQTVVASVVDVLGPYIGETMARSSARAHLGKLGITDGGTMNEEQTEALVARLSAGLKVFLPKEKCVMVIVRLRRALGLRLSSTTGKIRTP